MAKRLLKDWTNSEKVDKLSPEAERFFTRLIMKADDFGSFYANPTLLKANLFPLKVNDISDAEVTLWVKECTSPEVDLMFMYEVNGKYYLRIRDFGQRLRSMRGKFPEPPTNVSNSPTNDVKGPPEVEGEGNSNTKKETEGRKAPEFVDEKFKEPYLRWMEYKRKRRESYKSIESEEAFYKKLLKYSDENPEVASEIIERSMSNNWAGIFELKTNKDGRKDKIITPGKKFGDKL